MSFSTKIWLYRTLLVVALIAAWDISVRTGLAPRFLFGRPLDVFIVLKGWIFSKTIYYHLWITLIETILAFCVGTALGLGFGLWLALSPLASAVLDPFIKALNSMPRLILAPIFAMWFGLGIWSKVALGVTIVFFIVFFNVYQGVREVSPVAIANTRMLGATPMQLIRRVYIPSAMTWVFSSLHLSVGMAFVGAVIGEYLGAAAGVGYLILQAESTFDMDTVVAGIIVLTGFAIILDQIVTIVERRWLRWRPQAEHW